MNISATKEPKNLNPVKPIQITQINFKSMELSDTVRSSDPLEPMVSAEVRENVNGQYIDIKIIVLVPKTLLGGEPISLFQDLESKENELKFVVKCNSTELVAGDYYSWYVNYLHPLKDSTIKIDTITTRIIDLIPGDANPRTSRGTVTHVLQS